MLQGVNWWEWALPLKLMMFRDEESSIVSGIFFVDRRADKAATGWLDWWEMWSTYAGIEGL
jgi:hypothetical protein